MRFKEKRCMKVYAGNDQNYKPVAQIRLQGKWLEEIIRSLDILIEAEGEKFNNGLT